MLLAAADRDAQYRRLCRSRRSHIAGRNQTDLHRLDVRRQSGPARGRAPDLRCVADRMQRRAECRRGACGSGTETAGAAATAATTTATTAPHIAAATAAACAATARLLPA